VPRSPTDPELTEGQQGPQHGSPAVPPDPEQPQLPLETPPQPPPDELSVIKRQLEKLEEENRALRSRTEQPRPPEPKAKEEEIDWEKELFANPKAAVNKMMDMAGQKVEARLRQEYQRDRGVSEFWSEFYRQNPDLREDKDLVEIVLDKNLPELMNTPVEKAYGRLADLTRERIMRYVGSAGGARAKARAEGASPPSKSSEGKPKEEEIKSLSDILRERRRRRRGQAA
jgi:hypothetical protein